MMLDDEEEEGPRLKERLTEACQQFVDIFCVWDCCWLYIKLSEVRKNRILFINSVFYLVSLEQLKKMQTDCGFFFSSSLSLVKVLC